MALIANFVYSNGYNVMQWGNENLAVIPMLIVALAAMAFRARWVQIAAPILLLAIWTLYFIDLQGALK